MMRAPADGGEGGEDGFPRARAPPQHGVGVSVRPQDSAWGGVGREELMLKLELRVLPPPPRH